MIMIIHMVVTTITILTKKVGWGIIANHGGGYSYRLCKDDQELTEECFQVFFVIINII